MACGTIALVLLILIALYLYKRKVYLTNKLVKGVRDDAESLVNTDEDEENNSRRKCTLCSFIPFLNRKKPAKIQKTESKESNQDYQELCRQRMLTNANKNSSVKSTVCSSISNLNETANTNPPSSPTQPLSGNKNDLKSESSRSSTSSWSEEPINSFNIDITTGHVILAYMEEHLNDKNRLNKEWDDLCNYDAEPNKTEDGSLPQNMTKNRYSNILPCIFL